MQIMECVKESCNCFKDNFDYYFNVNTKKICDSVELKELINFVFVYNDMDNVKITNEFIKNTDVVIIFNTNENNVFCQVKLPTNFINNLCNTYEINSPILSAPINISNGQILKLYSYI